MTSSISQENLKSFVHDLDQSWLDDAPTTFLPVILPLALPTPLHTINFFTILHLVYDRLSSSSHAAYFQETRSTARDTAIRGTVSLYLASEEGWVADNLLSADAWKKGKLDERAMAEHFEIQVVREREHETMKAIRVGSRWNKGVDTAQALVQLFAEVGDRLSGRCVGEALQSLIQECWAATEQDPASFARSFVEHVSVFLV